MQISGIPMPSDRVLCVGSDSVLECMYKLQDEVLALFPSKYIHIGGDEVIKNEWKKCPRCQQRIKDNSLADEDELQAWFSNQILAYLKERGRTGIIFNETLKAKNWDKSAIVQYWDEEGPNEDYCSGQMDDSTRIIYSYTPGFYLDCIPAMVPLRSTFGMEPCFRRGGPIDQNNILGFECGLWAEQIPDGDKLETMAFPRLLAMAERAWAGPKDYTDFLMRCRQELFYLDEDKVKHYSLEEADPTGQAQIDAIIAYWKPIIEQTTRFGMTEIGDIISKVLRLKLDGVLPAANIAEIIQKIQ